MDAIRTIVNRGLAQNAKEEYETTLELNSFKELLKNNKNFKFELEEIWDKDDIIIATYTFYDDDHKLEVVLDIREITLNLNLTRITTSLIEFAIHYFENNNEEIKFNDGDYDGDNYVNIKEYIENTFTDEEKEKVEFTDITKRKFLFQ